MHSLSNPPSKKWPTMGCRAAPERRIYTNSSSHKTEPPHYGCFRSVRCASGYTITLSGQMPSVLNLVAALTFHSLPKARRCHVTRRPSSQIRLGRLTRISQSIITHTPNQTDSFSPPLPTPPRTHPPIHPRQSTTQSQAI